MREPRRRPSPLPGSGGWRVAPELDDEGRSTLRELVEALMLDGATQAKAVRAASDFAFHLETYLIEPDFDLKAARAALKSAKRAWAKAIDYMVSAMQLTADANALFDGAMLDAGMRTDMDFSTQTQAAYKEAMWVESMLRRALQQAQEYPERANIREKQALSGAIRLWRHATGKMPSMTICPDTGEITSAPLSYWHQLMTHLCPESRREQLIERAYRAYREAWRAAQEDEPLGSES